MADFCNELPELNREAEFVALLRVASRNWPPVCMLWFRFGKTPKKFFRKRG